MADAKDFEILERLIRDPFASLQRIGRSVGVSGAAVKARLGSLRDEGALQGIWGVPSPTVFRRRGRLHVYSEVARSDQAMAVALDADPVMRAALGHERSFEVTTYARADGEGPPPSLAASLGEPDFSATMTIAAEDLRAVPLSPLDLRILLPLVRKPRAPIREIAEITHLSRKTVRQHRDALFRKGLFRVVPFVAGARSPGYVFYRLFVRAPSISIADRGRILAALSGVVFAAWTEGRPGLWLTGGAPTMAEALANRDRAERLLGVTRAHLDVFVRHEFVPERIERWIQDELAIWDPERRKSRPTA